MHISDYSANLYRINTHFLYMKTFFHTVWEPGNLQASKWFPRALINRRVRCLPLRPFSPFLRALIAAAAAAVHAMATAIIVTIKKPLGVIWLLCVAPFSRPRFFYGVWVFVWLGHTTLPLDRRLSTENAMKTLICRLRINKNKSAQVKSEITNPLALVFAPDFKYSW